MNKSIKILIVEDDFLIAENIKEMLEEMGFENVFTSYSYDNAKSDFIKIKPDLGIFDIQIGHETLDGLDLIAHLKGIYEFPFIVLSSYTDQESQKRAFELKPENYLVKPVSKAQLEVALNKLTASISTSLELPMTPLPYLFLKVKDRNEKFNFDDIVYISAQGAYSTVYTEEHKYTLTSNIGWVKEKFSQHTKLVRCHRSYLINIDKIKAHDGQNIYVEFQGQEHCVPYSIPFNKIINDL